MKPKRSTKVVKIHPPARPAGTKNDQLKALEQQARQLGQSGRRVAEAVEVNTRILECDPENLPALTRRGLCYLKLDDYPAAKKDLTHARRLYPASSLVSEALKKIDRGWDAAMERARGGTAGKFKPLKKRKRPRTRYQPQRSEWAHPFIEAKRSAAEEDKARKLAAEEARKRTEKELRVLEELIGFEEVYALGVAARNATPPNYTVAIAAFKKAYKLDPRRKVRRGKKPAPGLFEVPTRLAAAYRLNGQLYEAQKTYEWVLEHHDSRFARVGLAAVYEDNRKHVDALKLYESVLDRFPNDTYALRGVARTLASLGRVDEAIKAYEKAAEASNDRKATAAVLGALEKIHAELREKDESDRARQVGLAIERLRGLEDEAY